MKDYPRDWNEETAQPEVEAFNTRWHAAAAIAPPTRGEPNPNVNWTVPSKYRRDPNASLSNREAAAHEVAAQRAGTMQKKFQHLNAAKLLREKEQDNG